MSHPGIGYSNQKFRYVVDETMEDGTVCARTLGWTNDSKPTLKDLNKRSDWANARYEEIEDRAGELDRPTRWRLSDMTPLPEYVPVPPKPKKVAPFEGLKKIVMVDDEPDFGPLPGEPTATFSPGPNPVYAEVLESAQEDDDEPDFSRLTDEEALDEMIAADDEEEDGWSI